VVLLWPSGPSPLSWWPGLSSPPSWMYQVSPRPSLRPGQVPRLRRRCRQLLSQPWKGFCLRALSFFASSRLPSSNDSVAHSRCPILERAIRLGKSSRKGIRRENPGTGFQQRCGKPARGMAAGSGASERISTSDPRLGNPRVRTPPWNPNTEPCCSARCQTSLLCLEVVTCHD